jgi:hypothetical protein
MAVEGYYIGLYRYLFRLPLPQRPTRLNAIESYPFSAQYTRRATSQTRQVGVAIATLFIDAMQHHLKSRDDQQVASLHNYHEVAGKRTDCLGYLSIEPDVVGSRKYRPTAGQFLKNENLLIKNYNGHDAFHVSFSSHPSHWDRSRTSGSVIFMSNNSRASPKT